MKHRRSTVIEAGFVLIVFAILIGGMYSIFSSKANAQPRVDEGSVAWENDPFETSMALGEIDDLKVQSLCLTPKHCLTSRHTVHLIKVNGHLFFTFGAPGDHAPIHVPDCSGCKEGNNHE